MPPLTGLAGPESGSAAVAGWTPRVVLTVAGHDPGSGAGVTADLLTFAAHGLFGLSAITALTVQSTLGVAGVELISAEVLRRVLDQLDADIPAEGVKIGMMGGAAAVQALGEVLGARRRRQGDAHAEGVRAAQLNIPIVLDPVLRSSSGAGLLDAAGVAALREWLLPEVGWVTPNWMELAILAERPVGSILEAETAAEALAGHYPGLHIVVTGGDQAEPVELLRLPSGESHRFRGERVATRSTHGTGCAFSAALLARLVFGESPTEAVRLAKEYVAGALRQAPGLGRGRGPMDLLWPLRS